jgi:hypothetical protein
MCQLRATGCRVLCIYGLLCVCSREPGKVYSNIAHIGRYNHCMNIYHFILWVRDIYNVFVDSGNVISPVVHNASNWKRGHRYVPIVLILVLKRFEKLWEYVWVYGIYTDHDHDHWSLWSLIGQCPNSQKLDIHRFTGFIYLLASSCLAILSPTGKEIWTEKTCF